MTQTEALKLALEALKRVLPHAKESMTNPELDIDILDAHAAITAIEARLSPQNELEAHWNEVRASYGARQAALEAKDEPVAHSVVAGALFDFMGWLTSREKRLILSSVDEASPAVEAITEFAIKRNLSLKYAEVGYWTEFLATPPQQEAKDEPVALKMDVIVVNLVREGINKHRARELAEHFIKHTTTPPQRKEPEPVVWMYQDKSTHEVRFQKHMRGFVDHGATYETPLYTTPPQRKPLTEEQIGDEFVRFQVGGMFTPFLYAVRAIEAAHGITGDNNG